nr:hypothetical protein JVH1_5106 [Rhodococcus sp. JVH1]
MWSWSHSWSRWAGTCFGRRGRRRASVTAVGVVLDGVGYIDPNAKFL